MFLFFLEFFQTLSASANNNQRSLIVDSKIFKIEKEPYLLLFVKKKGRVVVDGLNFL